MPAKIKTPRKRRRRKRGCQIGCQIILILMMIISVSGVLTIVRVLAFGSAISTQPPLSRSGDMSSNNRTNLLILGYGGDGHYGAYLTDSMLVVSLLPQSHHTSLVSIPRDLWVKNPYTTLYKINAIYTDASNNNQDPSAGGEAITREVGSIVGMNVKYWMTINFTGFRELINSIGGIDVDVPDSFSTQYPNNDDATKDASWKIVTFTKGNRHMDGETAIKYARARYAIDNPEEGTDFARSARQQIIIRAIMSKVKQITTWPRMLGALNALQDTIRTNLSFADLAQFTLDMDLNSPQTAHISLSVDNVLAYATSSDGQAIIVPQNNDWDAVASYVQRHLYN
jgi:LCP family protein required for cell wall assembly